MPPPRPWGRQAGREEGLRTLPFHAVTSGTETHLWFLRCTMGPEGRVSISKVAAGFPWVWFLVAAPASNLQLCSLDSAGLS